MPKNKDLKRLARTRMRKTGESYTTARAQLLEKRERVQQATAPDYAEIAGMSDDAVRAKTGRTWDEWVRRLDDDGGVDLALAAQHHLGLDLACRRIEHIAGPAALRGHTLAADVMLH